MRFFSIVFALFFSLFFFSCKNENVNQSVTSDSLISVNKKLKLLLNEKDSLLSSFIQSYSEIQLSLSSIRSSQKLIGANSSIETRNTNKQSILENINKIDELMKKNKATILLLKEKTNSAGTENGIAYENLIATLEKISIENDNEIPAIMNSIDSIGLELKQLNKKYDDALSEADRKNKLLNTAYYTAGNEKDLVSKGVITKQGGFIGLGKTQKLSESFNKNNFVKVDISKLKSIKLSAKKIKLITIHPQNSYSITSTGSQSIITINNPSEFWSASKYMVVLLEK
jgi:hypothetical protein